MMVDLIKFIACSAILMLLFHLLLAKEKTFLLNRWVLIFLVPAAMLVPFFSIPVFLPQESSVQISYLQLVQHQPAQIIPSSPSPEALSPLFWFLMVYLAVLFILLTIKISALIRLINWTKKDSLQPMKGARLVLSEKVLSPFSFGKFIFMHPSTYREGNEKTEMILKHELVHISQRHYIDLAIMEFLTVVCWFNPVVFMVKKAMVLNHEYLADQEVQNIVHPIKYKKLLLKLTVQNTPMVWTSAISSSTLKRRLTMINKPSKKTAMRLRIAYFSLSTLLIVAGFSLKINAHQPNQIPPATQTQLYGYQDITLEQQPEFKGGMAAFSSYVKNETKYPLHARMNGVEGQVDVQFVVEKDGSLSNVSAVRGFADGFEFLAERIIKNAPAFHPGMQSGRPVRVEMTIPVFFNLSKIMSASDQLPKGEISIGEIILNKDGLNVDAKYASGLWKGSVRDSEENLLPGAIIVVEQPSTMTVVGTVTNVNGNFSLKASSSATLIISFKEYKSVKLKQNHL